MNMDQYKSKKDRYKSEIRTTIKLAIPVMIGQVGQMMMSVVDSVMVGKLGAVPLAASSLAGGIFVLLLVMGIGVSQAITPLVAESVGAGKPAKCGQWLRQMILVCTGFGIVLAAITFLLVGILPYLGQPKEVVPEAMTYLRIMGVSVIPVMIFQGFRQYSEGLSIMWPAMIIAICANVLNVFLNWIYIYGNLGFEALGLEGAGYSTLGTRSVMMVVMIAYVVKSSRYKRFRIVLDPDSGLPVSLLKFKIQWEMIRSIIRLGLATAFQYLFELSAFSGAAIIIGWMGAVSLAAHQIAFSSSAISFMFAIGVSAAASVRVGKAKGEKDPVAIRIAGFTSFYLVTALMIIFAVLFVVLRFTIPQWFIDDPMVIDLTASLLIVAALFQVSDGLQGVALGIMRGLGDVKVPTIATFTSYWIIGLPSAYLLGVTFKLEIYGVWIGLLLGLTSSALLLTLRFHRNTRKMVQQAKIKGYTVQSPATREAAS